jgi:hypothetical protein
MIYKGLGLILLMMVDVSQVQLKTSCQHSSVPINIAQFLSVLVHRIHGSHTFTCPDMIWAHGFCRSKAQDGYVLY